MNTSQQKNLLAILRSSIVTPQRSVKFAQAKPYVEGAKSVQQQRSDAIQQQEAQQEEASKDLPVENTPNQITDEMYAARKDLTQPISDAEVKKYYDDFTPAGEVLVGSGDEPGAVYNSMARGYRAVGASGGGGGSLLDDARDIRDSDYDAVNNTHKFFRAGGHAVANMGRSVAKWINPRNWGSGPEAQLRRRAYDTARSNADRLHEAGQQKIKDTLRVGSYDAPDAPMWYKALDYANDHTEDVAAFTATGLATAGALGAAGKVFQGASALANSGGAAAGRAVASGVTKGVQGVGNAVTRAGANTGNLGAARVASEVGAKINSAGSAVGNTAGNVIRSGVVEIGEPFRYAAKPLNAAYNAMAKKDIIQQLSHLKHLRHPVKAFKDAKDVIKPDLDFVKAHPWQTAWTGLKTGVPAGLTGSYYLSAANQALSGDPVGAAADLGTWGAMQGLPGPLQYPAQGYMLYKAFNNPND